MWPCDTNWSNSMAFATTGIEETHSRRGSSPDTTKSFSINNLVIIKGNDEYTTKSFNINFINDYVAV